MVSQDESQTPMSVIDLGLVPSEQVNPRTVEIDRLSTTEMLALINADDQSVAHVVGQAIPSIAVVVDRVTHALRSGGRLFYVGAGTSGRLGVLDASECPPTYGTPPHWVQGVIAGGDAALRSAIEGAEDDPEQGRADMARLQVNEKDVVVGISASGGAAYVVAAMEAANAKGAFTAAVTGYAESRLAQVVAQPIVVSVGPEVITGSTRMKAGTAQKLVLNMMTTGAMVQLGKTYQNLMVDVQPTNQKLHERARRLVSALGGVSVEQADELLAQTGHQVKPAVLMARQPGLSVEQAQAKLAQAQGKLRRALEQ